ncbi:MAG: hypothetical protein AB1626_03365 [Candidatus Micrarchaeota archaeon]
MRKKLGKAGIAGAALLAALACRGDAPTKSSTIPPRTSGASAEAETPQKTMDVPSLFEVGRAKQPSFGSPSDWARLPGLGNLHLVRVHGAKAYFAYASLNPQGGHEVREFEWRPGETVRFEGEGFSLRLKLLGVSKRGATFLHRRSQRFTDLATGGTSYETKGGRLVVLPRNPVSLSRELGGPHASYFAQSLGSARLEMPPRWADELKTALEENHSRWALGSEIMRGRER